MIDPEVRILFRKEWSQLRRSRGPFWTSVLLPLFFLLALPMLLAFSFAHGANAMPPSEAAHLPAGLRDGTPLPFILPLLMMIAGLVLPTMTGTHAVISERETRTLELLVALPVRISQILLAKFLAVLLLASVPPIVLLGVDAVVLLAMKVVTPAFMASLVVLFVCALGYGTASSLLIGLLSRDYRTANNLGGLFIAPWIVLGSSLLVFVPVGGSGPLVMAAFFAVAAVLVVTVARKSVTFERLLR